MWVIGWVGLVAILSIGTFGLWWSFLIVINSLFCLAGYEFVLLCVENNLKSFDWLRGWMTLSSTFVQIWGYDSTIEY